MFKDILKKERENANLSQMQLSKLIKVSQQTIGSWETGRTEPNHDMLITLAQFFNISIDYLLGFTENKTPYSNGSTKSLADISSDFFSSKQSIDKILSNLKNANEVTLHNKPLSDSEKDIFIESIDNTILTLEKINKLLNSSSNLKNKKTD